MSKKTLVSFVASLFASSLLSNAYAVAPGFYMGAMAGPSTNSGSDQQVTVKGVDATGTPKSSQFAGRGYMGYQFLRYAGVEMGATYYSVVKYTTTPDVATPGVGIATVDVVGKGIFPVGSIGDVYGKLGGAVVYQGTSRLIRPAVGKSRYTVKLSPTFSLGVSYDLSQNWVADISWNRIMTGGMLNTVDFYALGFSYHFVDKYCGQFLCD